MTFEIRLKILHKAGKYSGEYLYVKDNKSLQKGFTLNYLEFAQKTYTSFRNPFFFSNISLPFLSPSFFFIKLKICAKTDLLRK